MGISSFFERTKRIILLPLTAVMFSTAVGVAGGNGDKLIIGTEQQIEDFFRENPSTLADYHTSDTEGIVKIHETRDFTLDVPYQWSYHYDNSEGMSDQKLFEEEFNRALGQQITNMLVSIQKKLPKGMRKGIKDQRQLFSIIRSSLSGGFTVEGQVKGYASPEGDLGENTRLSQKRADQADSLAREMGERLLAQWFTNHGIDVRWKVDAKGEGVITDSHLVKKAVDRLNESIASERDRVEWKRVLHQDKAELEKFTQSLRTLKARNPHLYQEIMHAFSALRKVEVSLRVEIDGEIQVVVVKILPHEKAVLSPWERHEPVTTPPPPPPPSTIHMLRHQMEKINGVNSRPLGRQLLYKNVPRQIGGGGRGGKFTKL